MAWARLRFCASMGWTFQQYDAQEVRDLAEAEAMVEKAAKFGVRVPLW